MTQLQTVALPYCHHLTDLLPTLIQWPYPCLLDSADAHRSNRYDIFSAAPHRYVTYDDRRLLTIIDEHGTTVRSERDEDPFAALQQLLDSLDPISDNSLPFCGGLLGYFNYELGAYLEPTRFEETTLQTPLFGVGLYHWAIVTDHEQQTTTVVFHPQCSERQRDDVLAALERPTRSCETPFRLTQPFQPSQSRAQYNTAFDQIQRYIRSGDCYEVNLTQRFSAQFDGEPWSAYLALRSQARAPFSAFISTPQFAILSHSPEQFVELNGLQVTTKPIKGTRPRGHTLEEDAAIAQELINSPKDRAENLMIVDLLRNDLGKVCKYGSIAVPHLFALESYSNVHHLVSTVVGELNPDQNALSLLKLAFPGGSITGAPKIRSMEIIRELEAFPREIYCGSIGFISCNGCMNSSITIRTLLAKENAIHCWGGGAIVSDSQCDEEYDESVTKVSHLMRILSELPKPL